MVPLDTVSGTELVVIDDLNTLEKLLAVTREDQHTNVRAMFGLQAGIANENCPRAVMPVNSFPDMVVGTRVRLLCLTRSDWYIGGWGLELEGYPGQVFALQAFATVDEAYP